jgi:hypothetical protein
MVVAPMVVVATVVALGRIDGGSTNGGLAPMVALGHIGGGGVMLHR